MNKLHQKSNPYIDYLFISIIVLLSIIIRLPELLDPQILDGDEALMGLMAKQQWEGKGIKAFFWGQRYGFTYLETSTIALFYSILGYSQLAVQSAMLLLWCLIMVGFYKLCKAYTNQATIALFLTLAFTAMPAWYMWSIKARGGYLTSFLAVTWVLYAIKKWPAHKAAWFLLGASFPFVFFSQALWIPSLLICLCGGIWLKNRSKGNIISGISGLIISYGIMKYFSMQMPNYWQPQLIGTEYLQQNIELFFPRILEHLGGNYFLGESFTYNSLTYSSTLVFIALLTLLLIIEIRRWVKHKKIDVESLFILLAGLAPWGLVLFSRVNYHPRYILPFTGFIFLWTAYLAGAFKIKGTWKIWTFGSIFFLYLMASSILIKGEGRYRDRKKEVKQIKEACLELKNRGYKYVLTASPELHWQIMFYSEGEILSRHQNTFDRNMDYVREVEKELHQSKTFPIVSYHNYYFKNPPLAFEELHGYYLLPEADSLDMLHLDFEGLWLPK